MSREWKPGDVATLVMGDEIARGIVRDHKDDGSPVWVISGHSFFKSVGVDNGVLIDDVRPLVVIDPESEDDAEEIVKAFVAAGVWRVIPVDIEDSHAYRRDQVAAALREFANPKPPKPECPAGLGAVVEDEAGEQWVHFETKTGWWWRNKQGRNARWHHLSAVRILSDGVQP